MFEEDFEEAINEALKTELGMPPDMDLRHSSCLDSEHIIAKVKEAALSDAHSHLLKV